MSKRKNRLSKGPLHPIDVHVGAAIRKARRIAGLSLEHVAGKLGVTYQQLQKNETGKNRVGASRLYFIACLLRVSIESFYDGLPRSSRVGLPAYRSAHNDNQFGRKNKKVA